MSSFTNFIKDYPTRCYQILKAYRVAQLAGREVTLMLAMASTGMIMVYERLANPKNPSDDKVRYRKAKAAFDTLCKQPFCGSMLWGTDAGSWSFGSLASTAGEADDWPELQRDNPIPPDKKVSEVLYHLRNAMAHGE